jgi:hypothetical protein
VATQMSENGKKENMIKYATWKVKGKAHKEGDLDSLLDGKQIKMLGITESKIYL